MITLVPGGVWGHISIKPQVGVLVVYALFEMYVFLFLFLCLFV